MRENSIELYQVKLYMPLLHANGMLSTRVRAAEHVCRTDHGRVGSSENAHGHTGAATGHHTYAKTGSVWYSPARAHITYTHPITLLVL